MAPGTAPEAKPFKIPRAAQFLLGAMAFAGLKAYQKDNHPSLPAGLPPAAAGPGPSRPIAPQTPLIDLRRAVPGADLGRPAWLRSGAHSGPGPRGDRGIVPPAAHAPSIAEPVPDRAAAAGHPAPGTPARATSPAPREPAPPPEVVLAIAPAAGVDEQLFLLRALETLYERWPGDDGDPRALDEAIRDLRHDALRHQRYIQGRKLDGRIAALYGDMAALADAYADCLAEAGRIERGAADRAGRERAEAAARSGFSGGAAAARALNNGAGGAEALATWAGITAVGTLVGELSNAPARDEARRTAIEANIRAFSGRYDAAVADAQAAAAALAGRHGWARGEAGFDVPPDRARQILEVVERGDAPGMIRLLDLARARRPRDPFLLGASALVRVAAAGDGPTAATAAQASEDCLTAASLVPGGTFYDPYRAEFLAQAGVLANASVAREMGAKGWVAGPHAGGPRALGIWRAYLALDPADPSGEAREQLAYALAATGRFAEAADAAGQVAGLRRGDGRFSYAYACLLGLTGRPGESLRWLEHAYRDCRVGDIRMAKADPDLGAVRAGLAAEFAALARVDFAWKVDWGFFDHDDIVLENRSPFPLTGVRLDVEVAAPGSPPWSQSFTAGRIEPEATHRWRTWVKARGNGGKAEAALSCDQQRE